MRLVFIACAALWPIFVQSAEPVNYLLQIKPLLKERCYACHASLKQEGDLRLDTAALLRRGGSSGSVISADAAEESLLVERISSTDASYRMPPEAPPLSADEIKLISTWIAAGADGPSAEAPEEDPRQHWAFQRPQRPVLPTSGTQTSHNPIDSLIAVELQRQGLTPQPPAGKNMLLRRVYLDLIGIPPTRAELHAFLADPSPEAYDKVVDRLLSSPQYGERWARHWMDVWRYADWYGRRYVPDVWNSAPQIWRWRDWIVKSLNDDHGYDRMVREMLAADEIVPEDDEAGYATGYLIRNWYALNPNDWMRNTVEHTGKAFLGLTFNCAHCHDHKYDPIAHDDYFRLRAFFEPIYVRQDRVPGQPEPGPFEDYDYAKLRTVQRLGAVRIFDQKPDAITWFYSGGDERNRASDRGSIPPGVPEFLKDGFEEIEPIELPPSAWYPGLRPAIQDAERATARQAISLAEQEVLAAKPLAVEPSSSAIDALSQAETALADARALAVIDPSRTALVGAQSLFLDASSGRCFIQNRLTKLSALEDQSTLVFQLRINSDTHFNFQFAKDITKGLTAGYVAFDQGRIVSYQPSSFTEFDAGHYDFAAGQSQFQVSLVLQTELDRCLLSVRCLSDDQQLIENLPIALNGWNPVGDPSKPITFDARTGSSVVIDDLKLLGPNYLENDASADGLTFDFESPDYCDGCPVVGVDGWEMSTMNLPPSSARVASSALDDTLRSRYRELETARRSVRNTTLPLLAAEAQLIAARAEQASVEARIAADQARYGQADQEAESDILIRTASRLERYADQCQAEASLLATERSLAASEAKPAEDAQRSKEIEEATQKMSVAQVELNRAREALHDDTLATRYSAFSPTYPSTSTGRRRALARWITSRNNPLTARVAVNHIWLRHFHNPLVDSLSDFGRNGDAPTHPALLDWLAVEFMESGWSMKHLHRLIVTSDAYRRASGTRGADGCLTIDPDNRYLWRMNTGRMEAEVIRDSLLHCAGQIDMTHGGQEIENSESLTTQRRSLYYSVYPEQSGMSPIGELFDGPDSLECYRRTRTVIPQQALVMTNSEFVHRMSGRIVDNWANNMSTTLTREADTDLTDEEPAEFIVAIFEQLLSRLPTDAELQACLEAFYQQRSLLQGSADTGKNIDAAAQASLVRALFSHSDFVTVR